MAKNHHIFIYLQTRIKRGDVNTSGAALKPSKPGVTL